MAQKAKLTWSQIKTRSIALRRGLEQLTKDLTALASVEEPDAISGYFVMNNEIAAWSEAGQRAMREANRLLESLIPRRAELSETLDERLTRSLREAGFEVYGDTALFVVNGVVYVETDARKGIVKVNGASSAEMSVQAITDQVTAELDRIGKVTTIPNKFIGLLLKAYEAEIAISKKEFGTQVQTTGLLCHLAILRQQPQFRISPTLANFREYPRETFRADLFSLLSSNITEVENRKFRFASGSDTVGSVFTLVPQLGRTAHVGRIWFENCDG